MATKKVTFTFDDATLARLAQAARRLDIPKSQVVRDAIRDYSARVGRLSEHERLRMLQAFDELVSKIPAGSAAEADAEMREVREARCGGGRATPERIVTSRRKARR
jgi:predicted transcriptional regulator